MAYSGKFKGVPSEMASKLGHLSIIDDKLVKEILESFQEVPNQKKNLEKELLEVVQLGVAAKKIICIDGSFTIVPHTLQDHKKLAYIKIAALGLNLDDLHKANKVVVDPQVLSKITSEYATTQSTVIPLSNVIIAGQTLRDTLRESILITFKKMFDGNLLKILIFLTSKQWIKDITLDSHFECINCANKVELPRNQVEFKCSSCETLLTIIDYIGFLSQVPDDEAEGKVATDLMLVLEHLTLIYYLKEIIESGENINEYLFLKDGPLLLSGQYSRLVDPIREYFEYLKKNEKKFNLVGVEKSGSFVGHIPEIVSSFESENSIFIPDNKYILSRIKLTSSDTTLYGERVLYGSKLFFSPDKKNVFVLTIPIGLYKNSPTSSDFINLNVILASIKELQSFRYENGLAPIVAVNNIASMSFYPSNNILARFSNENIKKYE